MSQNVLDHCRTVVGASQCVTNIKNGAEFQFRYRRSTEFPGVLVRVYFRRSNVDDQWQCANSLVLPAFAFEALIAMFPQSLTIQMSPTEARMIG